jgi:hypothetical protein
MAEWAARVDEKLAEGFATRALKSPEGEREHAP